MSEPVAPAAAPAIATAPVLGAGEVAPAAATTAPVTPAAADAAPAPVVADAAAPTPEAAAKLAADKAAVDKTWAEWKPKAAEGASRDGKSLAEFVPLARELGLQPEQAQKLLDFNDKLQASAQKQSLDAFDATRQGWISELKADKELGGEKYEVAIRTANKAFNAYVDPATQKQMVEMGIDALPGLVRAFHKVGVAMADDKVGGVTGSNALPSQEAQLRALYPNSPSLFAKKS